MPFLIRGESFPMPTENNTQGPTGREIIEIEDAFGLDGLTLLSTLNPDKTPSGEEILPKDPKYSKVKALYALAWISMSRAGKIVSIDDVLNTYSIEEIKTGVVDDPKEPSAAAN